MTVEDFLNLYKDPKEKDNTVFEFVLDEKYKFDQICEMCDVDLNKEFKCFTVVNKLDFVCDTFHDKEGMGVYPKATVYIYTTEFKYKSFIIGVNIN